MTVRYDGTFAGLLTAVFETYRTGILPTTFLRPGPAAPPLFEAVKDVETSPVAARRVAAGLAESASPGAVEALRCAHLTGEVGLERTCLAFVFAHLGRPKRAPLHPYDDAALARSLDEIERLARQIGREVHRMHAFVRFEEAEDGAFVAEVAPAFDVLDLLADHFVARYPAMRWTIRDTLRHRALVYDGTEARITTGTADGPTRTADEHLMQELWRTYFEATNIEARRNLDLQQRHVPLRYRPYMTELRPPLPRR